MALWIVQMIEHDLCYPNKLADCVFFIEVLFYAFTYTFWWKIMKKIHVLNSENPGQKTTTDAVYCSLLSYSARP